MRQSWSHLLFLHWAVPAEAISARLPTGLEVDTFAGEAYVGLVPFTMSGVRPTWAPAVPWLSSFHEVNVRTYVHRRGRDPGVWFFSLDAANPVAVWLARTAWHLPYYRARMRLAIGDEAGGMIHYESRRLGRDAGAGCRLRYRPVGSPTPAEPGTIEHFLIERYILYAHPRKGLHRGHVHHAPYPVQGAELLELDEDLVAAAGIERPGRPPLVHYASGVEVEVFPLEPATQSSR